MFIVGNATNGFTCVSVPKHVAFGAEGRLIIGGSDHGLVYVFERKSEKLLKSLQHSSTGLVQTIADAAVAWSGDLTQCMIATRVFHFSDHNLNQNAVFSKAPQAYQEVGTYDNILMLHELAGKLINVIQEAKKDEDMGMAKAQREPGKMTWAGRDNGAIGYQRESPDG
ncbi:hypothetical protein P692DRAFT_201810824 [Suillus brevipes Sb2]|nr:hypothetical protein P692DRAFT_201810824 [Suillus brevipes Sb2]